VGIIEYDVADLVEDALAWKPMSVETEREYEEQLYNFLHARHEPEKFYRKYARANTEADIFIESFKSGASVAIELKRDLVSRNEYHRLIGQTYAYLTEWKCEVLLVLCGQNDPVLVKLTREAAAFFSQYLKKVRVVEKAVLPATN
jgi:hypothetical protein